MSQRGNAATLAPQASFYIQRTGSQQARLGEHDEETNRGGNHACQLILAVVMLVIYLVTMAITASLVAEYHDNGKYAAAYTLVAFFALKSLTQIVLDYANNGRLKFAIFDILQLREVVEFFQYVSDWRAMRGKHWPHPFYRAHAAFNSFMTEVPSLIIQSYVYLREMEMTKLQVACIALTATQGVWNYLQFFQYIRVSKGTYLYMIVKGALTTAMRVIMAAFLMDTLQEYIYLWLALSYIYGHILCIRAMRAVEKQRRDRPLQFGICEVLYSHVIAIHSVFFAFPWAPCHGVQDWWHGYLALEVKIAIEQGLGVAVMLIVYPKSRDVVFYGVCFFGACALMAHYILLFFINMSVSRYLRRRSLYTTTKIVGMFTYFCTYLQEQISGQAQPDGGLLLDHEKTDKQRLRSQEEAAAAEVDEMEARVAALGEEQALRDSHRDTPAMPSAAIVVASPSHEDDSAAEAESFFARAHPEPEAAAAVASPAEVELAAIAEAEDDEETVTADPYAGNGTALPPPPAPVSADGDEDPYASAIPLPPAPAAAPAAPAAPAADSYNGSVPLPPAPAADYDEEAVAAGSDGAGAGTAESADMFATAAAFDASVAGVPLPPPPPDAVSAGDDEAAQEQSLED